MGCFVCDSLESATTSLLLYGFVVTLVPQLVAHWREVIMPRRILSLAVVAFLLNLTCCSSAAANSMSKEDEFAAKVKAAVAKIGVGADARIEVSLRDKVKLKGYVSEANEEGFVVVDEKTGVATQVAYSQVKKVKGRNKLSGEKIVAVLVLALLFLPYILHPGEP
jgi:hypothetical protein